MAAITPNTLALQLTRVRLLVQETSAQYWSDATLNAYIDEAQMDIAFGCVPGVPMGQEEPLLANEATAASVKDQEIYSLPTDLHAIRTVRARGTSTENYSELPIVDIEFVRAHPKMVSPEPPGTPTSPAPKPEAYFLWGESGTYQLGCYPGFNSANGSLYISYWMVPTSLAAGGASTVLQIPQELHIANTYLAAFKAWLERGHESESQSLLKMFVAEYQSKLAYIRRQWINQKRAVMVGVIGDSDAERTIF